MKEKIDNFFYYYKTHLIVTVFITVLLVIGIRSCVDRKDIDLKVVYFSDALTASETADTMEKSFAENGLLADIDGVIVVPRKMAYDVLVRAEQIRDNEVEIKEMVSSGMKPTEVVANGGYF